MFNIYNYRNWVVDLPIDAIQMYRNTGLKMSPIANRWIKKKHNLNSVNDSTSAQEFKSWSHVDINF